MKLKLTDREAQILRRILGNNSPILVEEHDLRSDEMCDVHAQLWAKLAERDLLG